MHVVRSSKLSILLNVTKKRLANFKPITIVIT